MSSWLRRIRGAVGTGLTWGATWAVGGIGIGLSTFLPWHPFTAFMRVMDAPLPAMAIPGFVAGVLFSGVLGVAARGRRFADLSAPVFALWGAVGGALLVAFPFALGAVGLASFEGSPHTPAQAIAAVAPVFILFSAASAVGSLLLARRAEERAESDLLGSGGESPALPEGDSGLGSETLRSRKSAAERHGVR